MSRPEKLCDLVMQGGITSGIVYPSAILELAREYRFEDIGGASAGAIAAVGAAAAEYGRQSGAGGFDALGNALKDLDRDGFLVGLFQPVPAVRRVFRAALGLVSNHRPLDVVRAVGDLAVTPLTVAAVLAAFVVLVGAALLAGAPSGTSPWPAALLLVLAVLTWCVVALVIALAAVAGLAWRTLGALRDNWYGLCPGSPQPGGAADALTPWIHAKVESAAGGGRTHPLTFHDLERKGVRLRLITTDLAEGRPITLPLPEEHGYLFRAEDMARLLPPDLVAHLLAAGKPMEIGGRLYHTLPGPEMPITLAARLSLSFPVLLSAVPLYVREGDRVVQHLMSDGGITSNFPIHLFDEWLPRHPTFGLSLEPAGHRNEPSVRLSPDPPPPPWEGTTGPLDFFKQVFDAARNWRDRLQAQLPNSRDRVCHIYLTKTEGGLHLDMPEDVRQRLVDRGTQAAREFAHFDWAQHRHHRLWTLMQMMQINMHRASTAFRAMQAGADDGLTETQRAWFQRRLDSMTNLLDTAPALGTSATGEHFNTTDAPTPTPVMRIVPDA